MPISLALLLPASGWPSWQQRCSHLPCLQIRESGGIPCRSLSCFRWVCWRLALSTPTSRAENAYKLLDCGGRRVGGHRHRSVCSLGSRPFSGAETCSDDPTLVQQNHRSPRSLADIQWCRSFLVWCAAIPAIALLNRKWIVGGLHYRLGDYSQQHPRCLAWRRCRLCIRGAGAAPPSRWPIVLIPMLVVGVAASPFIYRRIAMSLDTGLATNYSRVAYMSVGTANDQGNILSSELGPNASTTSFLTITPARISIRSTTATFTTTFFRSGRSGVCCVWRRSSGFL